MALSRDLRADDSIVFEALGQPAALGAGARTARA
jgi:hypothetical protein